MTQIQQRQISKVVFYSIPLAILIFPFSLLIFRSFEGFMLPFLLSWLVYGSWSLVTGHMYANMIGRGSVAINKYYSGYGVRISGFILIALSLLILSLMFL